MAGSNSVLSKTFAQSSVHLNKIKFQKELNCSLDLEDFTSEGKEMVIFDMLMSSIRRLFRVKLLYIPLI